MKANTTHPHTPVISIAETAQGSEAKFNNNPCISPASPLGPPPAFQPGLRGAAVTSREQRGLVLAAPLPAPAAAGAGGDLPAPRAAPGPACSTRGLRELHYEAAAGKLNHLALGPALPVAVGQPRAASEL